MRGAAVLFNFITVTANGALIRVLPSTPGGIDYQAYYDGIADLTWLANAGGNLGMAWVDANAWAASLNINGVTGWRLPDSALCTGYSECASTEMGNMFYNVLGGSLGFQIVDIHNANYVLFTNLLSGRYWTTMNGHLVQVKPIKHISSGSMTVAQAST